MLGADGVAAVWAAAFLMAAMARRRLDDLDMARLLCWTLRGSGEVRCDAQSRPLQRAERDKTRGAFCPVGTIGLVKNVDGSAGARKKLFSENEIFFVLGGAHRGRKASGTPSVFTGSGPVLGWKNITHLEGNVVCLERVIGHDSGWYRTKRGREMSDASGAER